MEMEKIDTHVADARARLLSQFADSPKLQGLLQSFTEQIQDISNANYDLYTKRWLSSATGVTLDRLGAMVNVEREGLDDDNYRVKIIGEINNQFSSGSNNDIITTAKNVTGASLVIFIEEFPATFILDCRGVDNASLADVPRLKRIIEKSKPAGVKFGLFVTSSLDAFSFAEDIDGLGFGIDNDPSVGGNFAIEI